MLLKNAYACLQGIFLGKEKASVVNYTGTTSTISIGNATGSKAYGMVALLPINANSMSTCGALLTNIYTNAIDTYSSGGVLFGDGNTPVTINDYALSGNQITGISASVSIEELDEKVTATYTITNNNDTAITISEIARNAKSLANSTMSYNFLVDRELVSPAITIEPGGVGQIPYTLEYNLPTS